MLNCMNRTILRSSVVLCNISNKRLCAAASDRVATRLDGIGMTGKELDELMKKQFDEDGSYTPMHASEFPSMSRRDIMMNVRIPPLGIAPPPFGDQQIKEITEKTTMTRENITWAREHWIDKTIPPDEKKWNIIVGDIQEMFKKGVSYGTINLWIDHVTGADVGCPHAIYNRTWARIDS